MNKFFRARTIGFASLSLLVWTWAVCAQHSLESSGPSKMNIAALNLKNSSGVAAGEAELISDRLRGDLFNTGKVNVMERDQMQEVLKEQGFQASGACTDEACLVQMGQLLGVQALVTGSLGKVGSMFMVNVRMIDVKTAKIVKVVSVDVRGDIEDVVGKLKEIAEQLVSTAPEAKKSSESLGEKKEGKGIPETIGEVAGKIKDVAVSVVSSKPEEKKVEEPVKQTPEPIAEKKTEAAREDGISEREKNRSGVRLCANIFLGTLKEQGKWTYYNTYGAVLKESYKNFDTLFPPASNSAYFNLMALFSIRLGQLFTLDLGPGLTLGSVTYGPGYFSDGGSYKYENNLTVFSMHTGFNYVKRLYPVKLNAGIIIEGNYLNYAENYPKSSSLGAESDTTVYSHGFNFSFGLIVGGEYLLNPHFGISMNFVLRKSHFETIAESGVTSDGYDFDFSRIIDIPAVALGGGINFYY